MAWVRMELEPGQKIGANAQEKKVTVAKKVLGQLAKPLHEQVIDLAVNTMTVGEEAGVIETQDSASQAVAGSSTTAAGANPRVVAAQPKSQSFTDRLATFIFGGDDNPSPAPRALDLDSPPGPQARAINLDD